MKDKVYFEERGTSEKIENKFCEGLFTDRTGVD